MPLAAEIRLSISLGSGSTMLIPGFDCDSLVLTPWTWIFVPVEVAASDLSSPDERDELRAKGLTPTKHWLAFLANLLQICLGVFTIAAAI